MSLKTIRRFLFTAGFLAVALPAGVGHAGPPASPTSGAQIQSIGPILTTVADMDRSVDFYSKVLTFERISDREVGGEEVEHLFGVFGARVRLADMKLGDESIELAQFVAPRGRPIPVDSRSNDVWFQHIAIIVSDMDRAYRILRENKVEYASSEPQRLPHPREALTDAVEPWIRAELTLDAFSDPPKLTLDTFPCPKDVDSQTRVVVLRDELEPFVPELP